MALPARARRVLRNLRQAIPSGVVLGRRSAGAGPTEFIDLSEIQQAQLDAISTVRGSVLYRGASDWAALPPGTNGHFLQTKGASADPVWAASSGGGGGAWALVNSFSASGGVIDVSLPGDGARYLMVGDGIIFDTDSVFLHARFMASGTPVSSAGAYNHTSYRQAGSSSAVTGSTSDTKMDLGVSNQGNAAGEEANFNLEITGADDSARFSMIFGQISARNEFGSSGQQHVSFQGQRQATEVNDGVRFYAETGNIDAGTVYLYKLVTA